MTHAIVLETSPEDSPEISSELSALNGVEVHTATKSSLDGSPEIALQIIQVALTAIAVIPPAVSSLLDRRRVSKIRLGDIEIENPTREQWETLWQQHLEREST